MNYYIAEHFHRHIPNAISLSDILGILNIIVLGWTLFWIWRYAKITKKMLENQITPNVEANVLYAPESKETYLWFHNSFNIPAFVTLVITITKTGKEAFNKTLRIPPYHPRLIDLKHTAGIGLFRGEYITDGEEINLDVTTCSAMKGGTATNEYRKSYRFNKSKSRWDETTWSFPDPAFPELQK
jgi:hypothetical protein